MILHWDPPFVLHPPHDDPGSALGTKQDNTYSILVTARVHDLLGKPSETLGWNLQPNLSAHARGVVKCLLATGSKGL